MIDAFEVRVLDRNSEARGVDNASLMDRAGKALSEEIALRFPKGSKVAIVCGSGNNGGDGFVAGRYLKEGGYEVTVLKAKEPKSDIARFALMWSKMIPQDYSKAGKDAIKGADVIVDGLIGTGGKGDPDKDISSIIDEMNSSGKPIFAIDVPSGLGSGKCITADTTVSFYDTKTVMYANRVPKKECGKIVVKDIGIPPEAWQFVGPGDMLRYPVTLPFSKKGDNGKVLFIGGGPYTGAPGFASMAALRGGADLVRVLVPEGIAGIVSSYCPDIIVNGIGEKGSHHIDFSGKDEIEDGLEWADVVLVGPGAGRMDDTLDMLVIAMERALALGKKLVVDADGLQALSQSLDNISGGEIVITPHRGEMRDILLNMGMTEVGDPTIDDPFAGWYIDLMSRLAVGNRLNILHKGPKDLIMGPGPHGLGENIERITPFGKVVMRLNSSGHKWMTKGGTGDVLAGLCAGMMARGMMAFDAACLASYVNGKAGEVVFERRGYSSTASDLLDAISIVV